MKLVIVGMADMQVTGDVDDVLVTYALGSCIAVMLYDPLRKVGGMIHYMLPVASVAPDKAKEKPAMFADTGIPMLFEEMYKRNCRKQDLIVKVAGGSALYDDNGTFEIGKRNFTVLKKMFWKVGVTITAEDVGGSSSRTTRLYVGTGRVTVRIGSEEKEL